MTLLIFLSRLPSCPTPPIEGLRRVKCTYSYSLLKLQFAAPKLRPFALRTTRDEKGKNKDSINLSKNSQYEKRTFLHWCRCCLHTFLCDWSRTHFCITRCFSGLCVRGPEADELTISDISIWQKHTLSFLRQSCDRKRGWGITTLSVAPIVSLQSLMTVIAPSHLPSKGMSHYMQFFMDDS